MKTLKNIHEQKMLNELRNKVRRLDSNMLTEQKLNEEFRLLMEEMKEEDLQKVSAIIDKLRAMQQQAGNSGALRSVVDKALMDLQKVTGGEQGLGQKFIDFASGGKLGNNAKVFKNAMGLVSALETAFRLMPQLIKNMIGPIQGGSDQAKMTVADLLTATANEGTIREAGPEPFRSKSSSSTSSTSTGNVSPPRGSDSSTLQSNNKSGEKIQLLTQNIVKAMKPSKWLGLLQGKIPYIPDVQGFVTDMLNTVPVGNLMQLVRTVTSGPQASNLAQAISNNKGGGQAQSTESGTQSSPTTGAAGSTPSTGTRQPQAKTNRGSVSKEWINDFSNYLERETGVDRKSIDKIMAVLIKNGKLHEGTIGHKGSQLAERAKTRRSMKPRG